MSPNLENKSPGDYNYCPCAGPLKRCSSVLTDNDALLLANAGEFSVEGAAAVSDDVWRPVEEYFELGARYGGHKSTRVRPNSK